MKIETTKLDGLMIIKPKIFSDPRGSFFETWRENTYKDLGIYPNFVQDNQSKSYRGILRGLHFQKKYPQGQLVWVSEGHIFDVCVDIRKDSNTFGQWFSLELNSESAYQVYMPPGFAHGFCVLSHSATIHYKCTDYYQADDESGIIWNDPALSIQWPIQSPEVSERDSRFLSLDELVSSGYL